MVILLAGNSKNNIAWIEQISSLLQQNNIPSKILYYDHWNSDKEFIDFDKELENLEKLVSDIEDYSIFAKSVGTLLALKGIAEKKINPAKCIFVGVAINMALESNLPIADWLIELSIPTLFIQNSNDPAGSADQISGLLENSKNENSLEQIPGDTHKYEDLEGLVASIVKYL